jgi:hypothetical protein
MNRSAAYLAQLADRQIEIMGIFAPARIPNINTGGIPNILAASDLDFFGDIVDIPTQLTNLWCLPRYNQWYELLSILGEDLENPVPLEVYFKTSDFVPRNTLIALDVKSDNGILNRRWFRVLSLETKHIENLYGKMGRCVPLRTDVARPRGVPAFTPSGAEN